MAGRGGGPLFGYSVPHTDTLGLLRAVGRIDSDVGDQGGECQQSREWGYCVFL
jgi:hypothetical protein